MRRFFKVNFSTISDAEEAYDINYFEDSDLMASNQGYTTVTCSTPTSTSQGPINIDSPSMLAFSPLRNAEDRKLAGSVLDVVSSGFLALTKRQRQQLVIYLFHKWLLLDVHTELNNTFTPRDFLPLAANAMKVLFSNGKNNVIYDASRCFGELRPGESCPRMPLSRMPFGLIAHNLRFFASDNTANLEAPADYKSWYQSMYTLFGNKWAAMHNGPMWSYDDGDVEEVQPPHAPQSAGGDSSTCTDILTEALQQTFGSDCGLLQSAGTSPAQLHVSSVDDLEPDSESNLPVAEESEEHEHVEEPSTRPPTSYLWTGMSQSEIREQEGATLTLPELEEMHNIRPSNTRNASNRDRNPLNVRMLLLFCISL